MCPASAEPRPAGLVAPTAVKREEGVGLSLASPMEGSGVAALGSGGGAEQEKVEATAAPAELSEGLGAAAGGGRAAGMSWEEEKAQSLREVSLQLRWRNIDNSPFRYSLSLRSGPRSCRWGGDAQVSVLHLSHGVACYVPVDDASDLGACVRCRAFLFHLSFLSLVFSPSLACRHSTRDWSVATEAPENQSPPRRCLSWLPFFDAFFFCCRRTDCPVTFLSGGAIRRSTGLGACLVLRPGAVHSAGSGVVGVFFPAVVAVSYLTPWRPALSCALAFQPYMECQ